jgi:hypothetical protein
MSAISTCAAPFNMVDLEKIIANPPRPRKMVDLCNFNKHSELILPCKPSQIRLDQGIGPLSSYL